MSRFWSLCVISILCAACCRPAGEAELNKPSPLADDTRCNAISDGEVKILRAGQDLLCVNGGDRPIDIEIAKGNGGDTVLNYNLSPHRSHKFTLPFSSGMAISDIYLRVNGGEWKRVCQGN